MSPPFDSIIPDNMAFHKSGPVYENNHMIVNNCRKKTY